MGTILHRTRSPLAGLLALAASATNCQCGDDDPATPSADAGTVPPKVVYGRDLARPVVALEPSLEGARVGARVTVTGTVKDATEVVVHGVRAEVSADHFSAEVILREGDNLVIAEARAASGGTGTDAVNLTVDTQPPMLGISRPVVGAEIVGSEVLVVGSVRDPGGHDRGLVVRVNGALAELRQNDFVVRVPVEPGARELVATAEDEAGNRSFASVAIVVRPATGPTIRVLSGEGQSAAVQTPLADPLVVQLRGPDGAPGARRRVSFEIARGSGAIFSGPGQTTRRLAVESDEQGLARAFFKLGARASAAGNVVIARAVGFEGDATFVIGSTPGAAVRVHPDLGNNQRGAPLERLPKPFVSRVLDASANPVSGVDVEYKVVAGGGTLEGESARIVSSDENGYANAVLTLGPEEGLANNVVTATFRGARGSPATFAATAVFPGLVEDTRISGEVVDMAQTPLPGVLIQLDHTGSGMSFTARTDAMGGFVVKGVPSGLYTLIADGDVLEGKYPRLTWELVAIAGRNNRLLRTIYLPKLDTRNAITVDEATGGTLTIPELPGVEVYVAPGSATFPDGTKSGRLTLTLVNHDRVPMPPPGDADGVIDLAMQPGGTVFDPPARVTFPNVEGDPPGTIANLVTFSHALGMFVPVGTMMVTEDGSRIVSEPGQGLPFAGWHTRQLPEPLADYFGGCNAPEGLGAFAEIEEFSACTQPPPPPGVCDPPNHCSSGCALQMCSDWCGDPGRAAILNYANSGVCVTLCGPSCLEGLCEPGCQDKIRGLRNPLNNVGVPGPSIGR
ncbi:MAG: carboxypeptidase regulatory-like domain-containing protein [Deltaproteobacteria bacterium]|nr:carboxypeptidase regulatory-like domain-containing protein [Deltaproteobacteria bacterium]